jgi:hypothetical protein
MTSDTCSAIPRTTLLTFALERQDPPGRLVPIDGTDGVAAHIKHCGHCRHLVDKLRNSQLALRGRILGAARDRAWSELNRRLRALRHASRRLDPCGTQRSSVSDQRSSVNERRSSVSDRQSLADDRRSPVDKCWEQQRAAVGALASRLEGLGIAVDLADLPTRAPSASGLPDLIHRLDDLLSIVGGADARHDPAEDYQPSAAPSFLDSLPPR